MFDELAEDQALDARLRAVPRSTTSANRVLRNSFSKSCRPIAGDTPVASAGSAKPACGSVVGPLLFIHRAAQFGHGRHAGIFVTLRSALLSSACNVISVRGGNSLSTLSLVRRKMNGRTKRAKRLATFVIFVSFDRIGKPIAKSIPRTKQSGANRAKQTPQFAEMILQRRAREADPPVRIEPSDRLRSLGLRVLDELSLIQHQRVPAARSKSLGITLQQLVTDDDQVTRARCFDQCFAIRIAIQSRRQRRCESLGFSNPVVADAGRGDDQGGTVGGPIDQAPSA